MPPFIIPHPGLPPLLPGCLHLLALLTLIPLLNRLPRDPKPLHSRRHPTITRRLQNDLPYLLLARSIV